MFIFYEQYKSIKKLLISQIINHIFEHFFLKTKK